MDIDLVQKVHDKYGCSICNYSTCHKSQYDRHILTAKHQSNHNGYNNDNPILNLVPVSNSSTNVPEFIRSPTPFGTTLRLAPNEFVCRCGKKYLHSSGLWRRHSSPPPTRTFTPDSN